MLFEVGVGGFVLWGVRYCGIVYDLVLVFGEVIVVIGFSGLGKIMLLCLLVGFEVVD